MNLKGPTRRVKGGARSVKQTGEFEASLALGMAAVDLFKLVDLVDLGTHGVRAD